MIGDNMGRPNSTFIHLTNVFEIDPQRKYPIPLEVPFFRDQGLVDPNYVRTKRGNIVFAWSADCHLKFCISTNGWRSFLIPERVRVKGGKVQFPNAIIEHAPVMNYYYGKPWWGIRNGGRPDFHEVRDGKII